MSNDIFNNAKLQEKLFKRLYDSPVIRGTEKNVFLLVEILAYDWIGVLEFANDFDFKHDLWYLVSKDKLTEETWKESLNYFNDKYDNVIEVMERYKFNEVKPLLIEITNINEDLGIHNKVYSLGFDRWVKGLENEMFDLEQENEDKDLLPALINFINDSLNDFN